MSHKLKLFVSSLLVIGSVSLGLVGSAAAASRATLSGHITQDGKGISSASITATCTVGGNIYTIHPSISTPSTGYYTEQFSNCPDGSNVALNATAGSASGSISGKMGAASSQHLALDVPLQSVALPEFGAFASVVAAGAVGVIITLVRRKSA